MYLRKVPDLTVDLGGSLSRHHVRSEQHREPNFARSLGKHCMMMMMGVLLLMCCVYYCATPLPKG